MKTGTIVCLTVAAVGYGAFLHGAKARGQSELPAPVLPMEFAMPAMPAVPAIPNQLAMPRIPEVAALAAMPEIPALPEMTDLSSVDELDGTNISLGHRHDGPADSCDDLRIRLRDEKPVMEQEERSVTKAQASVLRVHPMRNS